MDEITQAPKMFIAVTIISEIKKRNENFVILEFFLYYQLPSINCTLYISSDIKHNIFNEKTSFTQRTLEQIEARERDFNQTKFLTWEHFSMFPVIPNKSYKTTIFEYF